MITCGFLLHCARMTGAIQVDARNGLSFPSGKGLDKQHVKLLMDAEFGYTLSDDDALDLLTAARLQGAREVIEAAERGFAAHEIAQAPMGYLNPSRWRSGLVRDALSEVAR